jgi:hypothetical protein
MSDSQLPNLATIGSRASSESEETKPVIVAEDLEEVLRQSMPKTPPANRYSLDEERPGVRDPRSQQRVRSLYALLV